MHIYKGRCEIVIITFFCCVSTERGGRPAVAEQAVLRVWGVAKLLRG